ncbi:MAG: YHYH protein [Burkholderiales bacterium]|nr:YHYH protein [Burkholderiales bacterium]
MGTQWIRWAALGMALLVLSACGGGGDDEPPALHRAAAQAAPEALTADQLMDWAESQYASLFPVAGKTSGYLAPYTYRYYPQTGNYLGVSTGAADVAIYLYGNISGWQIFRVGALADYTCTVLPANCAPPGAPTIGTATAGNGSASIAFTPPLSSGASAITGYTATCTALSALQGTGTSTTSPIVVSGLVNGTQYTCSVKASNSFGASAASSTVTVTPTDGSLPGTSTTAGVLCSYSGNFFVSNLNKTSTSAISCTSALRTLTGNGIPDHATGTFPNASNPSAISTQSVSATMTMTPVKNANSTAMTVVGYAINSVKFDPNTNAHCTGSGNSVTCTMNGSGDWMIEALGHDTFDLGLDSNNAHVQPDGSYHYHGMPGGLVTRLGKGTAMTLVGFALDGFPLYARYGYTSANDAGSAVKVIKGSHKLKSSPDANRPSTASYPMGTFKEDYEFDAANEDGLDACNGRFGATPEFPNGIYHYYLTDTYPFIGRCVYGTASGGGGGGGGGPPPPHTRAKP